VGRTRRPFQISNIPALAGRGGTGNRGPGSFMCRAHRRGKPGFSTYARGRGRETDSLLEGAGFEPSVPAVKERPFVRNFDFRTAVTDRSGDNQEGRMVRIRLPPAGGQFST
jgi:hypothetical protein